MTSKLPPILQVWCRQTIVCVHYCDACVFSPSCTSLSIVCPPRSSNYTEQEFELKATAITTLTHNVLRLEKQSQSGLKQAAQSLSQLINPCSVFLGQKVCSGTPGPPGWPWLSVSPLSAQILMSSLCGGQGRYRENRERGDNRLRVQDKHIWICSSVPVTVQINEKPHERG